MANIEHAAAGLLFKQILCVAADFKDPDQARHAARQVDETLGPIEILVNSAGADKRYLPEQLESSAWHAAMQGKYFTNMHAMDAVTRGMRSRRRGSIVNIVSTGGKFANPMHIPGGAANSALMRTTVGLAHVLARQGIRINAINPGPTLTDRLVSALRLHGGVDHRTQEDVRAETEARIPLGRDGTLEEVLRVALFLASDQASYVTGAIIPMGGGSLPII